MNQRRICLLVEDDPEDQEFFLDAFHRVTTNTGCYAVSNGEEALLTLMQEDFIPDVIFTDLNMPLMGGLEFIKALKEIEELKQIPIIVYSSDYSDDQVRTMNKLGVTAIYSKTQVGELKNILHKTFRSIL